MVEACAVDCGPPSSGLSGTVAVIAAAVAAPFTKFLLVSVDLRVSEIFGSFFGLSMDLLP